MSVDHEVCGQCSVSRAKGCCCKYVCRIASPQKWSLHKREKQSRGMYGIISKGMDVRGNNVGLSQLLVSVL